MSKHHKQHTDSHSSEDLPNARRRQNCFILYSVWANYSAIMHHFEKILKCYLYTKRQLTPVKKVSNSNTWGKFLFVFQTGK